jgi:hypothetical protein
MVMSFGKYVDLLQTATRLRFFLLLSSSSSSPCLFSTTAYASPPCRRNRYLLSEYSPSLRYEAYTSVFSPSPILDRRHTNCRLVPVLGLDLIPFPSTTFTTVGSRLKDPFNFRSPYSLALVPRFSLPVTCRGALCATYPIMECPFP